MQTFLPYASFIESARVLDYRRLGKQRVEAMQILNALQGTQKGWVNHPAVTMWRGYEDALRLYHDVMIGEWIERGYNNNMPLLFDYERCPTDILPDWIGNEDFHKSHRSNLLRKDPEWYLQFGWTEGPSLEYVWPV